MVDLYQRLQEAGSLDAANELLDSIVRMLEDGNRALAKTVSVVSNQGSRRPLNERVDQLSTMLSQHRHVRGTIIAPERDDD